MKRIAVISFTGAGASAAVRLLAALEKKYICTVYIKKKFWPVALKDREKESLEGVLDWSEDASCWTGKRFKDCDGIIYIGAAGIAVRMIAPFVQDKMNDPAVVVIDEGARFSISLLSGHIGGANRLAQEAAEALGATAVITTATDLNSKFAVDLFAKENGLVITDRKLAKEISSRILMGEKVTAASDFLVYGEFPKEVSLLSEEEKKQGKRPDISITIKTQTDKGTLALIPRCVSLGIGCRKNTAKEQIWETIEELCSREKIDKRSIYRLASVDRKKDEPGLIQAARELEAEFVTFSPRELEAVPGNFEESEFVRATVGTGNVCERAAVCSVSGRDRDSALLAERITGKGVTAAAALKEVRITAWRKEWQES